MAAVLGSETINEKQPPSHARRSLLKVRLLFVVAITIALILGIYWFHRGYWPQRLTISLPTATPTPRFQDDRLLIESPADRLLGLVGTFSDELRAYLNFEYLRSLKQVDLNRVFLTATEGDTGPV